MDVVLPHMLWRAAGTNTVVEVPWGGTFEVVPEAQATVKISTDASVQQEVINAFDHVSLRRDRDRSALDIHIKRRPVDVAFEVFLRQHHDHRAQWRLGSFALPGKLDVSGQIASCPVPDGFNPSATDVVFRPSMDAALRDLHVTNIWGDQIVVENVEVRVEQ